MKKILRSVFALCLTFVMFVPTTFASEADIPQWQDAVLTDEEIVAILALNPNNPTTANQNERASDLIMAYSIAISKSGNTLYVVGKTTGAADVVKCGFKEIVIQRRANSSSSWSDYATYEDLYIEQVAYTVAKSLTVPSGYQYRATCIHYAKKNLFSVQKINNVSNVLTF